MYFIRHSGVSETFWLYFKSRLGTEEVLLKKSKNKENSEKVKKVETKTLNDL